MSCCRSGKGRYPTELASLGLITTGGLTLRLDRLEKAGLIIRERDTEDRRVVHAQLTDAGLKLVSEVARAHFTNELRMLSGLTAPEREQLAALLAKLERSLLDAEGEQRSAGTSVTST